MTITISNLRYATPDRAFIEMKVDGWAEGEAIPFAYHADDEAPLTLAVKELLATGNYEIADYVGLLTS